MLWRKYVDSVRALIGKTKGVSVSELSFDGSGLAPCACGAFLTLTVTQVSYWFRGRELLGETLIDFITPILGCALADLVFNSGLLGLFQSYINPITAQPLCLDLFFIMCLLYILIQFHFYGEYLCGLWFVGCSYSNLKQIDVMANSAF